MTSRSVVGPPGLGTVQFVSRGVLTLSFAAIALTLQILAMVIPGISAALLLLVFAAFVAVDGVIALGLLWLGRSAGRARAGLTVRTLLAIGVAVVALSGPIVAGEPWVRLATLLAAWAVLNGVLDVASGRGAFGAAPPRLTLLGAISIAIGAVLLAWPPSGMVTLVWWIVGYGVVYGAAMLVAAWRSAS